MTLIEYELELPNTKPGQALAKSLSRVLKHVYSATHVSFNSEDGKIIVLKARIAKVQLNTVRKALTMLIQSKKLVGPLVPGESASIEEPETVA